MLYNKVEIINFIYLVIIKYFLFVNYIIIDIFKFFIRY